jgi:hypothetical protein
MKVIVVHDGHKMYQDDNETYLTVSDGYPVLSGNMLYTTEKDYTRLIYEDIHNGRTK